MAQSLIVDIMRSNPALITECSFVVAAPAPGALEVILSPLNAAGAVFINANSVARFLPGDNVIIQSVYVNLPFGFGQGTGRHLISILWRDDLDVPFNIPEFANNSALEMPDLCHGIQFPGDGIFVKCPVNPGSSNFRLFLKVADLRVSLINVPTDLIGETIQATYYVSLVHTLPLLPILV